MTSTALEGEGDRVQVLLLSVGGGASQEDTVASPHHLGHAHSDSPRWPASCFVLVKAQLKGQRSKY